ncbi:MAG: DUF3160 domain-containing protein [Lachnospiraceae bacterium]|nr:DUF3160 domain-containing protein [Lachnospiraceae bacterium]
MKRWKKVLALILVVNVLSGCAMQELLQVTNEENSMEESETKETITEAEIEEDLHSVESEKLSKEKKSIHEQIADRIGKTTQASMETRPLLIERVSETKVADITPCVTPYTIEAGLGNVENTWQFYLTDEEKKKIEQNGFVVSGNGGSEFFEIYEQNRYELIPNFITVDSLMHTYHLYFSHLLKNIEKNYLAANLTDLSAYMLDTSKLQYEELKGSEWERAAKRNVAFFTIGAKLVDDKVTVSEDVQDIVATELDRIKKADGIYQSGITNDNEDYTQYIPRGYYEGDQKLEQYFRAMMWYGRIHFIQSTEDLDRSAFLITKALSEDEEAYRLWEGIYAVTSFFSGASDDNGVCEYAPVIKEVYGEKATMADLPGSEKKFKQFHKMTATLATPQINSIPVADGESNVIQGFRFMGQRFSMDATVMQKLVYSNVGANSQGEKRMLPDILDVPAALGSNMALNILEEEGAMDYEGYSENMELLKEGLSQENETLWSASLYAGWLNTLRPLLTVKGEGYPMFMQNEEWVKKDLECFAGSFAELKHDTILYSKQVMAEMGGGYEEEPDFRGYVQPEPIVYERFVTLSDMTAQGLEEYGMLSDSDAENLKRLSQMANQMLTISIKELQNEVLTEEEYTFIECYGGDIEHFWYEAVKDNSDSEYIYCEDFPAAIIADIATDPNGTVLEVGTGIPSTIYVVVQVNGKIKLASGSVYSFYQFEWPMDDRLTDSKWRQMMGWQADENGNYNWNKSIDRPEWTKSYRYQYEWE